MTLTNLPDMPGPGDRLPDEPTRAFAAFTKYRDLAPEVRSIKRAFESGPAPRAKGGTRASLGQWEKWSAEWAWPIRAQEWDTELDRVRRVAELAAVQEMGRRHAAVAMNAVNVAAKAIERIAKKLDAQKDDDEPFMTPTEVIRFAKEGILLERLSRGEPDMILGGMQPHASDPQESVRALLSSDPEIARAGAMLGAQILRVRREREEAEEG